MLKKIFILCIVVTTYFNFLLSFDLCGDLDLKNTINESKHS